MPQKYLYGAAVQGIQDYVFQTSKLREIAGASEIVKYICTGAFDKYALETDGKTPKGESIVRAAGNIKHIFDKEEDCRDAVLNFMRDVITLAPGIEISQAVVTFCDDGEIPDALTRLDNLLKIQRNIPQRNPAIGLAGLLRSRRTGFPAVAQDDGDYLDLSSAKKRDWASKGNERLLCKLLGTNKIPQERISYDIGDYADKNSWIAVIHADGNGLGQIIMKISRNKDRLKEFSAALDEANTVAARLAWESTVDKFSIKDDDIIPLRPIVFSGDDLTVICRGSLALHFTHVFLKEFEKQTAEKLGSIIRDAGLSFSKLTACAGIAYIKSSYPFHYGYSLAESLCSEAKADAKKKEHLVDGLAASCLLFHKVQDSFVEDYHKKITERLLTTSDNTSFAFGPYYSNVEFNERWTVDTLLKTAEGLNGQSGNALKSDLRRYVSLIFRNPGAAGQLCDRIDKMLPEKDQKLRDTFTNSVSKVRPGFLPTYDVLSLHSIIYQD